MNLCKTFQSRAISTWNLLRKARVNKFQPGEETITDLNLLEIKRKHPHEVILYKFTKPQESITGADWEWWLTGPSKLWLGLRIQAKVLRLETGEFPYMYYRAKSSSMDQTDRLIETSVRGSFPRIPLYCLYANWDVKATTYLRRHWRCGTFPPSASSYGCSLVSAFFIKYLKCGINPHPTLCDLLPYMFPWQCLVCCRGYSNGDLPQRAYYWWQGAILPLDPGVRASESGEDLLARYRQIHPVSEPPRHVLQLLEGNEPDRLDDPTLRGVVIIQELEVLKNDEIS